MAKTRKSMAEIRDLMKAAPEGGCDTLTRNAEMEGAERGVYQPGTPSSEENVPLPLSPPPRSEHSDHGDLDTSGWMDIDSVRRGIAVRVNHSLEGEGVLVFWKWTRRVRGSHDKEEDCGYWMVHETGQRLPWTPYYWKFAWE